jgi:hypothetical protein
MPTIPDLKPIIKVTEKQVKQLVRRLMSETGTIKPTAIRNPNIGEIENAARTEVIARPGTIQPFPEGPRTEVLPEPPFRESNMIPNPYAQIEMPEVLPPRRITQQRVGLEQLPPDRSDLIMNRIATQVQGPSALDKLSQYAEPPVVDMGRLYRDLEGGGGRRTFDLPIEEAREMLKKDASLYAENRPRIPDVKRLRAASKGEANLGEGFEKGLAYERLKWKPVETISDKVVQATVAAAAKESGVNITKEEVRTIADTFSDMWRGLRGRGRGSQEGQLWEMYRKGAESRRDVPRNMVTDAKTYFVRSAELYKTNPTKFAQQYPREAKRLQENWELYMNGAKSKGTKHTHYEGRQPAQDVKGFVE